MRSIVLVLFVLGLFLSGCAAMQSTSKTSSQAATPRELKDKIVLLEKELIKLHRENVSLKQEVSKLEKLVDAKVILTMPTGQEIQAALKNAGYYNGKVDGQIGSQTKEAIRKFQEANKLGADGVVGSRTWKLLRNYLKAENN